MPPAKCGLVMQTGAKHACIEDADLPSLRTALHFADRGQVLAKIHVAKSVEQAEHWDLHTKLPPPVKERNA